MANTKVTTRVIADDAITSDKLASGLTLGGVTTASGNITAQGNITLSSNSNHIATRSLLARDVNGLNIGTTGATAAISIDNSANVTMPQNLTVSGTLTAALTGSLASATTATTQSASDNSTKLATTAYVTTAIANLVDSSPSALNTLNELAAALGDDANFSTTVTNSIATKVALSGSSQTIADSADFTIDAAGDIVLDAAGNDIIMKDAGTVFGQLTNDSGNLIIYNSGSQMLKGLSTGSDAQFLDDLGVGIAPIANSRLTIGGTKQSYSATLFFDNNTSGGTEFFMLASDSTWNAGANKFFMGHGSPSSANIDLTIDDAGRLLAGKTSAGARSAHTLARTGSFAAEMLQQQTSAGASVLGLTYDGAAPNNTTDYFIYAQDTAGVKYRLFSDGSSIQSGAMESGVGVKVAGHPVVGYSSISGGYAANLGSTGTSTLNKTHIYAGGSLLTQFDTDGMHFQRADGQVISAKESIAIKIDEDNNTASRVFQVLHGNGNTLLNLHDDFRSEVGTLIQSSGKAFSTGTASNIGSVSDGDYIDIATIGYGRAAGTIRITWDTVYAPGSSHHGFMEFKVGSHYGTSYVYGWDTHLTLTKYSAHNAWYPSEVRVVTPGGSGATGYVQIRSGIAMSQGVFKAYLVDRDENAAITPMTPAVNNGRNSNSVLASVKMGAEQIINNRVANGFSKDVYIGGGLVINQQPFCDVRGDGTWASAANSNWNLFLNTPVENRDSCGNFSTSTQRFTCPVDGVYLMHHNCYIRNVNKSYGTGYVHVGFRINGSHGGSLYGNYYPYMISGYGEDGSTPYFDSTQKTEMLKLSEGDYIQPSFYSHLGDVESYENYRRFQVYLLG